MWYLVGLGNPGVQYAQTRHNVGWLALDHLRTQWNLPSPIEQRAVAGRVAEGRVGEVEVCLLYPNTFMNHSGVAVQKAVPPTALTQLVVLHDDIDVLFGEVKISRGRGAGGNNGVQSIIDVLGTKEFVRIRIGIAPRGWLGRPAPRPAGGGPLEQFVLRPFSFLEQRQLSAVYTHVQQVSETIISIGADSAMNRYN